jgi:hypothetical protein
MQELTDSKFPARRCPDWRGWIALAWVLCWGCGYCSMALKARGPRIVSWFRPQKATIARPLLAPDYGARFQANEPDAVNRRP